MMNEYPSGYDGFVIYHESDEKEICNISNKFRLEGLDLLMISMNNFWNEGFLVFGEKNLEGNAFDSIIFDCFGKRKKYTTPFLLSGYRCFYREL